MACFTPNRQPPIRAAVKDVQQPPISFWQSRSHLKGRQSGEKAMGAAGQVALPLRPNLRRKLTDEKYLAVPCFVDRTGVKGGGAK